jgi:hypothetical protein
MARSYCHITGPLQAYRLIASGVINTKTLLSDQNHRQLWIKWVTDKPSITDIVITAWDTHIDDRGYFVRDDLRGYTIEDLVGMHIWR